MNFLDISTLPGILTWLLLILLFITIAETVAVKDAQRKEQNEQLGDRIKKLEDEIDELYKLIIQQRNNLVCLQHELQGNTRKQTEARGLCYRVGLVCPRCNPRGTASDNRRQACGSTGNSEEEFPDRPQ